MSPQPHAQPAEEGLSCSTFPAVDDPERIGHVREMLSSFNHRCRNSLNGIKMSLYLFKRERAGPIPGCLGELERSYQQLEVLFDRLQVIYRPLTLTLVRSPLGRFFDERLPFWRSSFSLRGLTLDLDRPADDLPGDFDPMYLGLGLDAFVAWRAEAGQPNGKPVLSWRIVDGSF
jgi:signal transduction histidine kinase